jgi:lipopolysaccharide/colanic/teichoic acid biosynthesis glycosyltransferase
VKYPSGLVHPGPYHRRVMIIAKPRVLDAEERPVSLCARARLTAATLGVALAGSATVAVASVRGGPAQQFATIAIAAFLVTGWVVFRRLNPRGSAAFSAYPARMSAAGLAIAAGDLLLAGRGTPDAGLAACGLLAIGSITGLALARRSPRVLLVGDRLFRAHATRVASRSGRFVVGWLDSSEASTGILLEALLTNQDGPATNFEEIVVQDDGFFQRVYEISPELRSRAGRVLLVRVPPVGGAGIRHPGAWERLYEPPINGAGWAIKRAIDLLFAPLVLVAVMPILIVACIAIVIESNGSAIFRQERIGRDGRPFTMWKLRSMARNHSDAEHRAFVAAQIAGASRARRPLQKLSDDRRVTRVGRLLRKLSIDELPQLWNVFRGDMTLVGPRPPLPHEVELYAPEHYQRLRVTPGITGLWQVSGRSQLAFQEMVRLDVLYWVNWSLLRDFAILLRTPLVVVTGKGAV